MERNRSLAEDIYLICQKEARASKKLSLRQGPDFSYIDRYKTAVLNIRK